MRAYLETFQDRVCEAIEAAEGGEQFRREEIEREGGGHSRPRVLEDGEVVERAAVNFSHSMGERLPPAATERRPELAGGRYEAVSVSLIVHPRNPYAPESRVHRGGSFLCNDTYCASYRPSARMAAPPDNGMSHLGFRCAMTANMVRDSESAK